MSYGFIRRGFNWQTFRFGLYREVYRIGHPMADGSVLPDGRSEVIWLT